VTAAATQQHRREDEMPTEKFLLLSCPPAIRDRRRNPATRRET